MSVVNRESRADYVGAFQTGAIGCDEVIVDEELHVNRVSLMLSINDPAGDALGRYFGAPLKRRKSHHKETDSNRADQQSFNYGFSDQQMCQDGVRSVIHANCPKKSAARRPLFPSEH